MSLKEVALKKIIDEIIEPLRKPGEWKVLILDKFSLKIVKACAKRHKIISNGIIMIVDISASRRDILPVEAIYFIRPTSQSVNELLSDFTNECSRYKAAHVFFTEPCPEELFQEICKSSAARYMKTLKEINLSFLPCESRVFTVDTRESFQVFYSPQVIAGKTAHFTKVANQIVTLCATLGEYPAIRYRSTNERNAQVAQLVQKKLDNQKADDPNWKEGQQPKDRCQLLILDRGFDPISPLLHELTFQAMVYDLLSIENDVFKYHVTGEREVEVPLDESDELWCRLRHEYIATAFQTVAQRIKELAAEKRATEADKASVEGLLKKMKKAPQFHKELHMYSAHFHLAEKCMQTYPTDFKLLCKLEQDLVMGEKVDPKSLLLHTSSVKDKLRIILLYVIQNQDLDDETLMELFRQGNIPQEKTSVVRNVQYIGMGDSSDATSKTDFKYFVRPQRHRSEDALHETSRWTPVLKDILKRFCENKLSVRLYPFLLESSTSSQPGVSAATTTSTTTTGDSRQSTKLRGTLDGSPSPRLIVFIIGGVSYNEMRCVYEMNQKLAGRTGVDIILGSTHILTPRDFLEDLENLTRPKVNIMSENGSSAIGLNFL